MIHVSSVPYEHVAQVWPMVKGYLSAAVVRQKLYSLEAVLDRVLKREVALWVVLDDEVDEPIAVATTRIVEYPERRGLAIDWIGGVRMSEWLADLHEMMERYARDMGCSHIEGAGREGWVKALAPFGYKRSMPTYHKELTDG